MNVFQAEIRGDQCFMAGRNLNGRTVVPDSDDSPRPASMLAYTTDEGFFGKRQGKLMISDRLSASLEQEDITLSRFGRRAADALSDPFCKPFADSNFASSRKPEPHGA